MKRTAIFAALAMLCAPAGAADLPRRATRLAPGGSVGEIFLAIRDARARREYVVMPAGSAWESADTMWLSEGDVFVSPQAWFGFHEAQSCPQPGGGAMHYGEPGCVHSAASTKTLRANVPACVRRLGDYWHVWDSATLKFFSGAAILGMCASDPTIHPLR